MRTLFIVFLIVVGTVDAASAYFDTGNDLYDVCRRKTDHFQGACIATISGAFDMMYALGYTCEGAGDVTREQLRDVAVKFLTDNPQHRNAPAVFSILLAFETAFRCKKQQ
jgi:hypothetical protein